MSEVRSELRAEKLKKKKLEFKQHPPSFRRLYYWGKLMGLNPLSLSKTNKLTFSYIALCYGCLLGSFYCYIASRAIRERINIWLPRETPIAFIVDFMRITWEGLNGSSTWIVFAIHQNRLKLIVKSFVKVEETSKKLGIPDDYEKHFKEFGSLLTRHNLVWMSSMLLSEIMWSHLLDSDRFTWRILNMSTIVPFNMVILFVWALSLVKQKFHRLNERVQLMLQNENLNIDQTIEERTHRLLILPSSCNPKLEPDTINVLSELHRDLRITVHRIEKHFAAVLLFSVANHFTYITLSTYRLYRCLKEKKPDIGQTFQYLGAVSHEVIYPIVMLIAIINVCGSTVEKANNTGNMLHAMINNCKNIVDTRITAEVDLVSLDLLQNQVSMSIFGLFKLDYFLACSIVVSVTNYLTIMLQLQV